MRMSIYLAVFTTSFAPGTFALAGDDLLSEIRLDATVAPSETSRSDAPPASRSQGKRVGGASSLQTLLLAAGYSVKVTGENEVTASISRSDWAADVIISLASDGRNVRIALQLPGAQTNIDAAPETLRSLLNANSRLWGMAFAMAEDNQHIELLRTLPNDSLTGSRLREDLETMADYADKNTDLWKIAETNTSESQSPVTTAQTTTASAAGSSLTGSSLTGKWIASPTKSEAFALQLDSNGSFRLVHVKGTNSTKSQGTYQLTGTSLSLKGDDGKNITGTVARNSGGFSFSLKGTGGKTVALTFKSSS